MKDKNNTLAKSAAELARSQDATGWKLYAVILIALGGTALYLLILWLLFGYVSF